MEEISRKFGMRQNSLRNQIFRVIAYLNFISQSRFCAIHRDILCLLYYAILIYLFNGKGNITLKMITPYFRKNRIFNSVYSIIHSKGEIDNE